MEPFERFRRWVAENTDGLEFNNGADKKQIESAEQVMGLEFPADLRGYLIAADGQAISSNGIMGNWDLMPLRDIVNTWKFQKQMVKKKQFGPKNENEETQYVKGVWWNVKWIPIVHEATGDHVCIDMDPNVHGTVGQVILFRHDDEHRPMIAHSLAEWFGRIADDLESEKQEWDKSSAGFSDEGFMSSAVQGWNGEDQ